MTDIHSEVRNKKLIQQYEMKDDKNQLFSCSDTRL